jgi:N6-L-threonylcarbamoyladenine synthase
LPTGINAFRPIQQTPSIRPSVNFFFNPTIDAMSPDPKPRPPVVLGIESSCDDTAAAVWDGKRILAQRRADQSVHRQYGGVVPELASRAHQSHILPLVHAVLEDAGLSTDNARPAIDAIAVTQGPGLLGSLLVGLGFAKGLALGWKIPLIGVHHMKAHVLAHFIEPPFPPFPFLCLTVSGGHTQLVRVAGPTDMQVLGQTLDDAAGEAFDKCAKMLGLPYPGGPEIDRLAGEGDPERFRFKKPRVAGLDFSFSGLKTSVRYFLDKEQRREPAFVETHRADLCAGIQADIVEMLLVQLEATVRETGLRHVALAGGVSANAGLRQAFGRLAECEGWTTYIPKLEHCTDNGAMIARAGAFLFEAGVRDGMDLPAMARMPWS